MSRAEDKSKGKGKGTAQVVIMQKGVQFQPDLPAKGSAP